MGQPEKTFKHGNVTASVFVNEFLKNGKTMKMPKIAVQKSYKDKDEWKSTNSYDLNDLPKLVLAANKAYDYLTSKDGA